ncbi:hypothetical protein CKM354_000650000 [Cercospora kikuchii]|uniref:Apple domain-containing protein n=1 Tax=Cercospora kikuchii TaxID=84275 RepID=A0A9P3CIA5_9PEZI|nr:uncharacterized protein CKM354_000650000 [Cercospora kikuchii]GIZ43268.1 hypothetical protein CKM354_000650000 [Cercospora kikuchii]
MRSSLLVSGKSLGVLLSFASHVTAQWAPGGSYFSGSGAPGAATYRLVDDYTPSAFLDKFTFYDRYGPTYGHVKYVNRSVALTNGYAYYSSANNSAVIKPDTINKWPPGMFPNGEYLPGRPSGVVPGQRTGFLGKTGPQMEKLASAASWVLVVEKPANTVQDILEGVHTSDSNTMSLHSSPNCSIAGSGQTGTLATSNCDSSLNGNSGCGSELKNTTANPNNYGASFNAIRGGVYATEWTSNYIKHWWFPRGQIPASITAGNPDVSTFGHPAVNAQGACDIDSHFRNMSIIINIDFCGAWAGNVYDQWPNCPQNVPKNTPDKAIDRCNAFVGEYPERMSEAYWEINRIQVFQMPADVATTSTYSTSLSSVVPTGRSTNTIPLGMGATTSTLPSAPAYTGPVSTATSTRSVSVSSSLVTFVSTKSVSWVSGGITYSSPYPVTIATTATFEVPGRYHSAFSSKVDESSSGVTSQPATMPSSSSRPACPGIYDEACGAPSSSDGPYCSNSQGKTYAIQCGRGFVGAIIPQDQIVITIVPDSYKRDILHDVPKRVVVPNYASCSATCDNTAGCVAFQFEPPNNCTVFSEVTGTYDLPGGVGAAAVPDTSNPPSYAVPTTSSSAGIPQGYTDLEPSSSTALTATTAPTLPSSALLTTPSSYIVSSTTISSLPPLVTTGSSTITGISATTALQSTSSAQGTTSSLGILTTRVPSTCPRVVSGTGYTTITKTYTMTTCIAGEVCAYPDYTAIGNYADY